MFWVIILVLIGLFFAGWCIFAPTRPESFTSHEDYQSLASNAYNLEISPHIPDVRYWPYYHYTLPYRYEQAGAWPPGMYSRFSHWHPGYHTHTWSFDKRPGMGFVAWPRNRWVRNNGSYYHIDNGTIRDRMYDYYGRS